MTPDVLGRPSNRAAWARCRLGRWPHMSAEDSDIWAHLLRDRPLPFDRFEYDVCVGGDCSGLSPGDRRSLSPWSKLRLKRLDVVGFLDRSSVIFEVKPVAGFTALGQCLGYRHLWNITFPDVPLLGVACVCRAVDPDLRPLFDSFHIDLLELPLPSVSLR